MKPRDWVPRLNVNFGDLAAHLRPLGSPTRLRLLQVLTTPLSLEEASSRLNMSRQGVKKHLDELMKIGVVQRIPGERDSGHVLEYALDRSQLFRVSAEFSKLGRLRSTRNSGAPAETAFQTTSAGTFASPGHEGGPCLAIVRGLDDGRRFGLANQPGRVWRIGRSKDAEIRLDYDPFLSSRHAEIRRDDRGFVIVDAFSSNGTWVNWNRMERGSSSRIESGDVLGVGRSLLVFQNRSS